MGRKAQSGQEGDKEREKRSKYYQDITGETREKIDELHNASGMTLFGGSTSANQLQ